MARYIDADKIPYVESEDGVLDDYAYRYDINEIPSADVVEVVWCKDCKHWTGRDYDGCCLANGLATRYADAYCSFGERKES